MTGGSDPVRMSDVDFYGNFVGYLACRGAISAASAFAYLTTFLAAPENFWNEGRINFEDAEFEPYRHGILALLRTATVASVEANLDREAVESEHADD